LITDDKQQLFICLLPPLAAPEPRPLSLREKLKGLFTRLTTESDSTE